MTAAAPRIRRAYDPPARTDGKRVLIDRLWPRGLARAKAGIDLWLKDVAPSDALRREFGHDPVRWRGFENAYRKELAANPAPVGQLIELCRAGPVTLLFAAHDAAHNNAVVLAAFLAERLRSDHG